MSLNMLGISALPLDYVVQIVDFLIIDFKKIPSS